MDLRWFHKLAVVNSGVVSIDRQISIPQTDFSKNLEEVLLDHIVGIILGFFKIVKTLLWFSLIIWNAELQNG